MGKTWERVNIKPEQDGIRIEVASGSKQSDVMLTVVGIATFFIIVGYKVGPDIFKYYVPGWFIALFAGLMAFLILLLGAQALWNWTGREVVTVRGGLFEYRREFVGIRFAKKTMQLDKLGNFRVAVAGRINYSGVIAADPSKDKEVKLVNNIIDIEEIRYDKTVLFDHAGKTYRIGSNLSENEAHDIIAVLETAINPPPPEDDLYESPET